MGDCGSDSLSLSSLLCQENDSCFNEEEEDVNTDMKHNPRFVLEENEDEYMRMLVQRETSYGSKSCVSFDDCLSTSQSWSKHARLDAIEWILNTRAIFGFQFHTAYLSVTYFDRFLSKRSVDEGKLWAIRLLSVACLSLAAKMEECDVPALSEFVVPDYDFENKVIQRMELLILNTLEWKMGSITPFAYLHYFINKFCGKSRPNGLVSRAVELILAIIKEINSMNQRPSAIAAAAVLAASDSHLTRKAMELKMNVISSWGPVENEHVFSCYKLMQEIEMGKIKTPKSGISPNLSPIHSSSTDVLENSYLTFGAGTKRKLIFNDSGENCAVKKIHRPQ